jgi:hypothetical protein
MREHPPASPGRDRLLRKLGRAGGSSRGAPARAWDPRAPRVRGRDFGEEGGRRKGSSSSRDDHRGGFSECDTDCVALDSSPRVAWLTGLTLLPLERSCLSASAHGAGSADQIGACDPRRREGYRTGIPRDRWQGRTTEVLGLQIGPTAREDGRGAGPSDREVRTGGARTRSG